MSSITSTRDINAGTGIKAIIDATGIRGYWSIVKAVFMSYVTYRVGTIFTVLGNLAYMVVVYFLWQRIYDKSEMMHGMTFNQAFVYLTLAASIFLLFRTFTDWAMSRQILSGEIVSQLIKPIDHQLYQLAGALGSVMFNGLLVALPSLFAILVLFGGTIPLGINIPIFLVSLAMAYIMVFTLDYMTGLTSFYTESIWGISIAKETIISVLSGALIPLPFFPEAFQQVLRALPFQAMYHTPLRILTTANLTLTDYGSMLTVQVLWVIVLVALSRLFFRQAIKKLVVNGG